MIIERTQLYYLSRKHRELLGTGAPISEENFRRFLSRYERRVKTISLGKDISYITKENSPHLETLRQRVKKHFGPFIEYVDPRRFPRWDTRYRKFYHSKRMLELNESIRAHGVITPVLVIAIWEFRLSRQYLPWDGYPYFLAREGKHRVLSSHLIEDTRLIPAWTLIPVKDIKYWQIFKKKGKLDGRPRSCTSINRESDL